DVAARRPPDYPAMTAERIDPARGAASLSARDLIAGYGSLAVLDGVSLELRAGELLAIVGPNGAGKSTLLRLLAGTLAPWRGAIELDGRALRSYPRRELARRIATV